MGDLSRVRPLRRRPLPVQFLTFLASLEAIFLSTFVMIGQDRYAARTGSSAAPDPFKRPPPVWA
jgi:uncharacterized membrane protein